MSCGCTAWTVNCALSFKKLTKLKAINQKSFSAFICIHLWNLNFLQSINYLFFFISNLVKLSPLPCFHFSLVVATSWDNQLNSSFIDCGSESMA